MASKERPARRGYFIALALMGVIYAVSMGSLHWSFPRATLVASGGIILCGAVQALRHGGVNREIRRRR